MSDALDEIKKKNAHDNKVFLGTLAVGAAACWQNAKQELRDEAWAAERERLRKISDDRIARDEEIARGTTASWDRMIDDMHRQDKIRAGVDPDVATEEVKQDKIRASVDIEEVEEVETCGYSQRAADRTTRSVISIWRIIYLIGCFVTFITGFDPDGELGGRIFMAFIFGGWAWALICYPIYWIGKLVIKLVIEHRLKK